MAVPKDNGQNATENSMQMSYVVKRKRTKLHFIQYTQLFSKFLVSLFRRITYGGNEDYDDNGDDLYKG